MKTWITGLGAAGLATVALSGCNVQVQAGTPSVAKADLEKSVAEKFTAGNEKPQSVTCPNDLKGSVGSTIDCDVVVSPTNAFVAKVTVNKVEDSTVHYDIASAMSKANVELYLKTSLAQANNGQEVQSATCDGGLDGTVGAKTHCQVVDPTGRPFGETVAITSVNGLVMHVEMTPD